MGSFSGFFRHPRLMIVDVDVEVKSLSTESKGFKAGRWKCRNKRPMLGPDRQSLTPAPITSYGNPLLLSPLTTSFDNQNTCALPQSSLGLVGGLFGTRPVKPPLSVRQFEASHPSFPQLVNHQSCIDVPPPASRGRRTPFQCLTYMGNLHTCRQSYTTPGSRCFALFVGSEVGAGSEGSEKLERACVSSAVNTSNTICRALLFQFHFVSQLLITFTRS